MSAVGARQAQLPRLRKFFYPFQLPRNKQVYSSMVEHLSINGQSGRICTAASHVKKSLAVEGTCEEFAAAGGNWLIAAAASGRQHPLTWLYTQRLVMTQSSQSASLLRPTPIYVQPRIDAISLSAHKV
jgi:hypothetical protein